jgi:hypothetical protein
MLFEEGSECLAVKFKFGRITFSSDIVKSVKSIEESKFVGDKIVAVQFHASQITLVLLLHFSSVSTTLRDSKINFPFGLLTNRHEIFIYSFRHVFFRFASYRLIMKNRIYFF